MNAINRQPIPMAQWLTVLGKLLGANGSDDRIEALVTIGTALADEFAADAFCTASAVAVARGCLGFPTYGRVHGLMREWADTARPARLALPASEAKALPAPAAVREDWSDPKRIAARVSEIEAMPADRWRVVLARNLLDAVRRAGPQHLGRFRAQLEALVWPPAQPGAPRDVGQDEPAPSSGSPALSSAPLPPELRLALAEVTLKRNPHDTLAQMRAAAARRQIAERDNAEAVRP